MKSEYPTLRFLPGVVAACTCPEKTKGWLSSSLEASLGIGQPRQGLGYEDLLDSIVSRAANDL